MLASFLAQNFAATGLWPLLWDFPDDPDSYMGGHGLLDAIDSIDLPAELTKRWCEHAVADAHRAPAWDLHRPPAALPPRSDPFHSPFVQKPARLLLVPCNRPADAITVLGGVGGEIEPTVLSALLRTWEHRFAAVPIEAAPALLRLHVDRPPANHSTAVAVASEIYAISSDASGVAHLPMQDIATTLLSAEEPDTTAGLSRTFWDLGV